MTLLNSPRLIASSLNKTLTNVRYYARSRHPFRRTLDVLTRGIPFLDKGENIAIEHTDVVIIGGGVIGSSIAYWLKTRAGQGLSVTIVEKDITYQAARNCVSLGGINQHFSLPENVLLSQYGAEFYRNIKKNLNCNVDIQYYPTGYLILACKSYGERLEHNATVQKELGVKNELLTPETIRRRYPWINTDDVALGCIGTENEGSFNSWSLLSALIQRCKEMGTNYVNAEVTGFELLQQRDMMVEGIAPGSFRRINKVLCKNPDGEEHEITFAACILAAGGDSSKIAELAEIGVGNGLLSVPLPIEHRKHHVYTFENNTSEIGINTPLLQDSSGVWLRRNGLQNEIICGHLLLPNAEMDNPDEHFNKLIQPPLANRVPALANPKIKKMETEWIDYNSYDGTGFLGPHCYHNNLYLATGFGEVSYQHAPGIGRAIAELIIDGHYTTIDFTRFCFDRLLTKRPMVEMNVY